MAIKIISLPARISIPEISVGLSSALGALVLFFGALAFCLPVPYSESVASMYPWWARRIDIGNVVLHELVFMVWLGLFGCRIALRALIKKGTPGRQAAIWLIALALSCGMISMVAPLPLWDLGRTLRLLLNAVLLFAVVRWTRQSDNLPLGVMNLGFLCGTIINLLISFQYPLVVNGSMRLSGQNTPGVAMGIAIHLSCWLFFRARHLLVQGIAITTALVCTFGCAISYSRIGWFAGAFGLTAWGYILIFAQGRTRGQWTDLKTARRRWLPLLAIGLLVLMVSPFVQEKLQMIQTLVQQKLFSEDRDRSGDGYRVAYFVGVGEILTEHPMGVGYSGFFDAMTSTRIYYSGKAAEEVSYDANPHATFLWYASAGGIPGAVMAIMVFVMLLHSMRIGLVRALGLSGLVLYVLVAFPFLLIGLTVPYLFNSIIMIAPTAIAGGWGWKRWVDETMSLEVEKS